MRRRELFKEIKHTRTGSSPAKMRWEDIFFSSVLFPFIPGVRGALFIGGTEIWPILPKYQ
jgi:hypothetical protein